jgi:hypothetical protein
VYVIDLKIVFEGLHVQALNVETVWKAHTALLGARRERVMSLLEELLMLDAVWGRILRVSLRRWLLV